MDPASGADRPAAPASSGLSAAAGGVTSAAARFLRALTGLFGLELRETGAHALVLVLLGVAIILACVFAYLFLLTALVVAVAGFFGGGWIVSLLALSALHVLLAAVLWFVVLKRARRPLFPGTCEALRREMERIS